MAYSLQKATIPAPSLANVLERPLQRCVQRLHLGLERSKRHARVCAGQGRGVSKPPFRPRPRPRTQPHNRAAHESKTTNCGAWQAGLAALQRATTGAIDVSSPRCPRPHVSNLPEGSEERGCRYARACASVVAQRCVVCALAVVGLRAGTARDEEGGDALDGETSLRALDEQAAQRPCGVRGG